MAGDYLSSQPTPREGSITGSSLEAGAAPTSRGAGKPVEASGSDIRLTLPARPENVAVVRHVLAAFADALGLPTAVREDLRLAVTEACTNVVRHAYGEEDGLVDIVMRPTGKAIEVIVADSGRGHGPSSDTAGPGLGMALISALADSLEVERCAGSGRRLVMRFRRSRRQPAMGLA